jgi:hypothetical protein
MTAPLFDGQAVAAINGDILVVPQATLGGKLKGKALQYGILAFWLGFVFLVLSWEIFPLCPPS